MFPIVGKKGAWGAPPAHPTIFLETPSPIKTDAPPWGVTPHLKMKPPPSEKQTPPLKREAPFHEMIPRKSTINNNLKSS